MAIYTDQDLLQKWSLGELTTEQAIGQLLQHLQQTRQQLTELEQRTRCLERLRENMAQLSEALDAD